MNSEICTEMLLDLRFMKTIDILLTNKWSDTIIRENLNQLYENLEKAYKNMK